MVRDHFVGYWRRWVHWFTHGASDGSMGLQVVEVNDLSSVIATRLSQTFQWLMFLSRILKVFKKILIPLTDIYSVLRLATKSEWAKL